MRQFAFPLAMFCLLGLAASAPAENWPQWRGPDFNGVAPSGDYPIEWSADENVAWKAALPGRSGSTPAVWEDFIFVTCPGDGKNLVLCFNRQGQELWRTEVGGEVAGKHRKGSGTNPSPTTDGERVYVYFKSGDLAALDFQGKTVWHHNLQEMYGEDTLWWDLGTSPVLTPEAVVVACMQSGPSYLAAFDKETGDVLWKVDRMLPAPRESAQSYSTPVVHDTPQGPILVVLGADHVTGHDAATGHELWRVGGLNPNGEQFFRSIASAVICQDLVIAPYARGDSLTAIRLGGSGDVTDSHVEWERHDYSADVPTPAALGSRVYICTDKGEVACLDGPSGDVVWADQVERSRTAFSSSPVVAGGNIYITREDGTTFVLAGGDEFRMIGKNALGEDTLATPVFVDGKILLRTFEHLYCIGE